jgi:TRAP-type mannitol/chloroaromatic compound transport system permease small subunit
MLERFIRLVDRIAVMLGFIAMAALVALVVAMLYEVAARYVFNRPTLWAFDISYMLNGALFYLAAAYALKSNAHVRIDFLSSRLPERVQVWINTYFFLALFLPIMTLLSWVSVQKAWRAWATGEVEAVSPWAPLMWPFLATIAIGMVGLTLQILCEALRLIATGRMPAPDEHTAPPQAGPGAGA